MTGSPVPYPQPPYFVKIGKAYEFESGQNTDDPSKLVSKNIKFPLQIAEAETLPAAGTGVVAAAPAQNIL